MKCIIAGSRGITDPRALDAAMAAAAAAGIQPTVVLSGTARGVDRLGELWATARGLPIERFPADWQTLGKRAGFRRNEAMAAAALALVALWDGHSPGTRHMIETARRYGLRVFVHVVPAAC